MKFKSLFRFALLTLSTVFILCSCSKNTSQQKSQANNIQHAPDRIVSLSPAGTEILCAVGAENQIVARTDFCDFPKSIKAKPSVGGFSGETLSIETILSYKPDFVYGTAGVHDNIARLLEQSGVPVYLSRVNSVDDVLNEIAVLGTLTGHSSEGLECYQKMKRIFEEVSSLVKDKDTPLVYYEVWNAPFMSIGSRSYIAGLVKYAGGKNIFSDLSDEYPLISEEAVVARMPEIIIIPDMNGESKKSISDRSGWNIIPAVKNGRIYFAESSIFSRPGPRMTEALVEIAKMIHPDVDFSSIDSVILSDCDD